MAHQFDILLEIFPHMPEDQIRNIIQIVEEHTPDECYEAKLETMYNMLSGGDEPDNEHVPIPIQEEQQFIEEGSIDENDDENVIDPIVICEQLRQALPNADPTYLRTEANRLATLNQQDIDNFVQDAIENEDYPTMEDYLKRKKEMENVSLYTDHFKVDTFLELFPNAVGTFTNPNRKLVLNENSPECDIEFARDFLMNKYPFVRVKYIDQLMDQTKNLVTLCDRLDRLGKSFRSRRKPVAPVSTNNIQLLQLVAFLKNRILIKRTIKLRDESYRCAKEEARKCNLLEKCKCCFDDELIPEECYFCIKGCVFCKECVKLGAENVIGNAELRVPCFAKCDSEFSLQTLQMVLPPKMFQKFSLKISSEEIKKANVDGLETCPFCDFAMVLRDSEKVFKCINEDCRIESCRECRHKSHIPLRCNEIEYDEDVQRRTYIENKMTEALTRTCYNCNKTFIKTNGCNKMTCSCGAKMCYLCRQPINDYNHFGSNADGRCALHTNDNEINLQEILQNVQKAKEELGNVQIKFDPTIGIQEFYRNNA